VPFSGVESPLFVPVATIGDYQRKGRNEALHILRSQASFRLRIALNLKGIAREDSFLLGEGRSPASPSATREGARRCTIPASSSIKSRSKSFVAAAPVYG